MILTPDVLSAPAAFLLGFLGSAHCLGMCGGISASLGMAVPVGPGYQRRRLAMLGGYNLGRIASYGLMGLLIALPGQTLTAHWSEAGHILRTLAGIMLVVLGLSVGRWWQGARWLEKLGAPLWKRLAPIARRMTPVHRLRDALFLGALWGWLPCGLTYSTLGWAALQGQAWQGGLLMLLFGLGTLPAMLATGLAGQKLAQWQNNRAMRRAGGALIILFGLWTLPVVGHTVNHWLMNW